MRSALQEWGSRGNGYWGRGRAGIWMEASGGHSGMERFYFPLLSFPRVDTRTVPMSMRICPNRGIGVSVLEWMNWNAVAEATGSKRDGIGERGIGMAGSETAAEALYGALGVGVTVIAHGMV